MVHVNWFAMSLQELRQQLAIMAVYAVYIMLFAVAAASLPAH